MTGTTRRSRRMERRLTRAARRRWRGQKRERAWWRLKSPQPSSAVDFFTLLRLFGAILFGFLFANGAGDWTHALFAGLFYLLWIGVLTTAPFQRAFDSHGLAVFYFYPTTRTRADRRLVGRARWANLDWFLVALLIALFSWADHRFSVASGWEAARLFFGLAMLGLLGMGVEPLGRKFWPRKLFPAIALVFALGLVEALTNGVPSVHEPLARAFEMLGKFTPLGWFFAPLFGLVSVPVLTLYGGLGMVGVALLWNRRRFEELPPWLVHFPEGWCSQRTGDQEMGEEVAKVAAEPVAAAESADCDWDVYQRVRAMKQVSIATDLREEREREWPMPTRLDRLVFGSLSRPERATAEWFLGRPPGWRLPWRFPAGALLFVIATHPAWWGRSGPVELLQILRIAVAGVAVMTVGWFDLRKMIPALEGAVLSGRRHSVCAFQPVALRDVSRWISRLILFRLGAAFPWVVAFLMVLIPPGWWVRATVSILGACILISGTFLLTVPGYIARIQSRRIGWIVGPAGESLLGEVCLIGSFGGAFLTSILAWNELLPGGWLGTVIGYGIAAASLLVLVLNSRRIARGRRRDFLILK